MRLSRTERLAHTYLSLLRAMADHGGEIVMSPAAMDAFEETCHIVFVESKTAKAADGLFFNNPTVSGVPIRIDRGLSRCG